MNSGNPFILGLKGQGHESQTHCRHGSSLLWVLASSCLCCDISCCTLLKL